MSEDRAESAFPDHGLARWFSPDGALPQRIRGVFRLDSETLAEISSDPHALAQAFGVVVVTSVLVGLGRLSPTLAFFGIAVAIVAWVLSTGLIWAAGVLALESRPDAGRLLRVSGFAYAWNALQLGSSIPFLGPLLVWAGFLGSAAALVLGARHVMGTSTLKAAAIVIAGLAVPFLAGLLV